MRPAVRPAIEILGTIAVAAIVAYSHEIAWGAEVGGAVVGPDLAPILVVDPAPAWPIRLVAALAVIGVLAIVTRAGRDPRSTRPRPLVAVTATVLLVSATATSIGLQDLPVRELALGPRLLVAYASDLVAWVLAIGAWALTLRRERSAA